MRVVDLVAEHSLQLRLETPSSMSRLEREVARCAPAEHLDPTPYLEPDVLILTSGIGMNFSEPSIWDGYVERLARVPTSAIAFAVGTAHGELPRGLIDACITHDMPLFEVPTTVPLFKINQHVEYTLQAERSALRTRGWQLADECARLANQGAELSTLLAAIYATVELPIALYDTFGSLIAQYPATPTWRTGPGYESQPGVLNLALPMGLSRPCWLTVRAYNAGVEVEPLLTPVSSILALQLNRSVTTDASNHKHMQLFLNRCVSWSESTRSDVANAFQEFGLSSSEETSLLVADMSGDHAASSWKLRVALHDMFHEVRVTEIHNRLVALMQLPRDVNVDKEQELLRVAPELPLVLREPTRTIDELRIAVVHALDSVQHLDGPQLAPRLGLSAVVAAAAGRGAREAAVRFLSPLLVYDEQRSSELVETLRAWLRNDARMTATCRELFIHRNSLSYRLNRIESILNVSLDSLESKASCLMALRLVDIEPY